MSVEDLSAETAPGMVYERHLREGVLAFQRCDTCQEAVFFPRVLCPTCGGDDLTWQESTGVGTVYSATSLHPRGEDSYNVSLIDLDDGFRMMSNVIDIPASEVAIGMRVRARITTRGDEVLPLFVKDEQ